MAMVLLQVNTSKTGHSLLVQMAHYYSADSLLGEMASERCFADNMPGTLV